MQETWWTDGDDKDFYTTLSWNKIVFASVWYSFLFSFQQLDTVLNIIKDGFFVCLPYLDFVYISCDMRKRLSVI